MPSGRLAGALRRTASATGEQAVATGFVGGWRVVRALPEERAHRLFEALADRIHDRDGRSVQQLRRNLRRVRPELDDTALRDLTHRAVRSYLRYWCESFRLPAWPTEDLVSRTRTVHEERLRPERLYDEFVAFRSGLGMRILPLDREQPPLPRLAEYLRQGGFVCLLADRDLSRTAVDVTLCDAPARLPAGPALLARETGAPLVPATLGYAGRGLEIHFHEEVPVGTGREGVRTAMQAVADAFTRGLRAHPEDWHMMQRVFTDDPGIPRASAAAGMTR